MDGWIASATAAGALFLLALFDVRARLRERARRRAWTPDRHPSRQLTNAADRAISAAWEQALRVDGEPRLRVTVAEVQQRAYDDFNLDVPRRAASAVLWDRLVHGGHLERGIVDTDATPP